MAPSDIIKKYFRPGVVLSDRYQIEKLVGAGAYSAIFSAIDSENGKRVAIKAVPPLADGGKKTSIGRFQREMKVIGKLRHPNIISLSDFGETDERIGYMVIEFIQGRTLFDIVDGAPMTPLEAIDVTRQIAKALSVAHSQGVIHRDLKPQNVMLVRQEDDRYLVKVLDFGMAKLTRRFTSDESIEELTREGIAVGTPRYIAPEQARGQEVGGYSDLYALGLLMYEMFTGERAIKADTIESAIRAHVSSTPHDFTELHQVPPQMHNILFKLTAKQVGRRYQRAEVLIEDLDRVEMLFEPGDPTVEDRMDEEPTTAYDFKASKRRHSNTPLLAQAQRLKPDTKVSLEKVSVVPKPQIKSKPKAKKKKKSKSTTPQRYEHERQDSGNQLLLAVISVLLFPLSFLLTTAIFNEAHYFLKLIIGLLPLIIAGGAILAKSKIGPLKLLIIASCIGIVFSHLVSPHELGVGLWRHSAWFLTPFLGIPGVAAISEIIVNISHSYVETLISISQSFSPRTS